MQEVGFEPTPPKRLVPETSALDHSATLADILLCFFVISFLSLFTSLKKRQWQDLNLRLQRRSDFESHALDHSATLSCLFAWFLLLKLLSFFSFFYYIFILLYYFIIFNPISFLKIVSRI